MENSITLRDAVLRFFDRFSANDVDSFDSIVTEGETLFIGTGPDDWFTDRERLRRGFAAEGFLMEPQHLEAWEEGSVGWAVDEPIMRDPKVGPIRTRFSAVFRREGGSWKLVMSHLSVGIPDDEVVDLQRRWSASDPSARGPIA